MHISFAFQVVCKTIPRKNIANRFPWLCTTDAKGEEMAEKTFFIGDSKKYKIEIKNARATTPLPSLVKREYFFLTYIFMAD